MQAGDRLAVEDPAIAARGSRRQASRVRTETIAPKNRLLTTNPLDVTM